MAGSWPTVRNLTARARLRPGSETRDAPARKTTTEGCPAPTRVLDTPPMSSERRKEIDRRRRRRERALKARKHEAIKAAAATKKKR